ncbi:MAG: protoporphyrinogen oxidase [Deltaproteobacteria bacterium]|nr:protoporphyrinogen oxidase [Deltaproteobacteria bacterium]
MQQCADERPIVVIGGGIAGMAAASTLCNAGYAVTLLERKDRLGGVIETVDDGPYRLEMGPFSYLPKAALLPQLAAMWGVAGALCEADPAVARNRFVLKGTTIHRLPLGPKDFLRSPLLRVHEKLRLLLEPWAKGPPPEEETIAAFVQRRAGRGVLENLIQPFVSGVVAGDAGQLSVSALFPRFVELERAHGSLLRAFQRLRGSMARSTLFSFRGGMETLARGFVATTRAHVVTGADVLALRPRPDGVTVVWRDASGEQIADARAAVLAPPAPAAATLLRPLAPAAAALLQSIPYAPLVMMHTVVDHDQLTSAVRGFGFLATRGSAPPLLGSIWASSIFPERAPPDEVLMTWFAGGMLYPEAIAWEDHRLQRAVRDVAVRTLGMRGDVRRWWIRRYPQAIPQYFLGHRARIAQIEASVRALGPMALAGNYLTGVSVDDAAQSGVHAAAAVMQVLEPIAQSKTGRRVLSRDQVGPAAYPTNDPRVARR